MPLLQNREANYRRGTILGLTAAEAFMLISFILLLLLGLYVESNREHVEFSRNFTTETQRQAAVILRNELEEIVEETRSFEELVDLAGGERRLREVLWMLQEHSELPAEKIRERVRLLDDQAVREIAETASRLNPEEKLALKDLIRVEEFPPFLSTMKDKFSLEEIGAAVDRLEKMPELERQLAEYEAIERSPEEMQQLADMTGDLNMEEVNERLQILDDQAVREIAKQASRLDSREKLALEDLMRMDEFSQVLPEINDKLTPEDISTIVARLEEMQELERQFAKEVSDLQASLSEYEKTGMTAEEIQGLVDEIRTRRQEDIISAQRLSEEIREKVGDLIASLGGRVLDNGNVIFPDTRLLFDQGQYAIKPEFDAVLQSFCIPWLETLHRSNANLRNIQIEGHASSEWAGETPYNAFRLNLDLSQDRAAAVFKRCLDLAADSQLYEWAKTQLAAVGYSSSRPVRDQGGTEDQTASRRVVFAIDLRTIEGINVDEFIPNR